MGILIRRSIRGIMRGSGSMKRSVGGGVVGILKVERG